MDIKKLTAMHAANFDLCERVERLGQAIEELEQR